MAEATQILARDDQIVLLPDVDAGCPLADMIDSKIMKYLLEKIRTTIGDEIIPVVYVNSNSDVKSVCGEWKGSTCTSSSAYHILKHYLDRGKKIFFAPDYNLGINTAKKLGIHSSEIVKIGSDLNFEPDKDPSNAKLFNWDGNCHVHKRFKLESIDLLKEKYPNIQIIVHPECDNQLVEKADLSGSTQFIYDRIKNSPANTIWGVGTEYNFVYRIQLDFPDKLILPIIKSPCFNMARITEEKVLNSLRSIRDKKEKNNKLKFPVPIDPGHKLKSEIEQSFFDFYNIPGHKLNARKALETMINIVESSR